MVAPRPTARVAAPTGHSLAARRSRPIQARQEHFYQCAAWRGRAAYRGCSPDGACHIYCFGSEPRVVVHFKGGAAKRRICRSTRPTKLGCLFRFVAEEANPGNRLGVERVELFFPADLLADGTVIIDTPGVGSTLRHNPGAAFRVLPEFDAVLFVLSADPPITELELDYLRRLKSKTTRIFFVLNKADYLRPEDRRSKVDFLQKPCRKVPLRRRGADFLRLGA